MATTGDGAVVLLVQPCDDGLHMCAEYLCEYGFAVIAVGESMRGEPVELVARHEPRSEQVPYERLLRDALRGDPSLFTSDDSVEAAWQVIDQALRCDEPVHEYEPDSWGPRAAADLVMSDEGWHDPKPDESAPAVAPLPVQAQSGAHPLRSDP